MNFETIKAFNIDHHHHQFVAVVLWRWANCLYPIHLILWGSLCTLERCSVVEYIGAQLFSHVILDTFDSIWQSLPIGKIQCSAKLFSHSIRYIYFYEVVFAFWRMLCSWIHWSKIILTCQFLIHLILWALGVHIMCDLWEIQCWLNEWVSHYRGVMWSGELNYVHLKYMLHSTYVSAAPDVYFYHPQLTLLICSTQKFRFYIMMCSKLCTYV